MIATLTWPRSAPRWPTASSASSSAGGGGSIESSGVAPASRGQGIARRLVDRFSESAEDHGIKSIFTLVNHANPEMVGFFSRIGFVQGQMLHFQKEVPAKKGAEPSGYVA